jgi:hypothetical protein
VVAQNVTNNLEWSARVDLTRRMAVTEDMSTELRRGYACAACVFTNPMADRGGCERTMRQRQAYEDGVCRCLAGPTSA